MEKVKQTEIVLSYLKVYGELTTMQAVEELHVLSLPRRIMELRRAGHNIVMEYRYNEKTGKRYGVYSLAS